MTSICQEMCDVLRKYNDELKAGFIPDRSTNVGI